MANIVSRASGNLTTNTTWKTVETGTRAIQSAHSASTNTTTSDVYNADAQDFTIANLSVIEGILLFCNRINTTGTVRVTLSEDSGSTATRTVTIDAADLPVSPSWVFFEFGSTLTGDGGTDYAIAIHGSSANNATFFRDATTANWTHLIVTDQNPGSVAAGDVFFVVGELTGQGTGNDFTITMDSTSSTDYGTGSDGTDVNGMEIGKRGIVTYGTTAATNYYLKLSGSLNVWGDGILNVGTTGTPIPRDSTAVLEFDPVADGGMGLLVQNGGTCNIQGLSRTSEKNIVACRLNTDEAIDSTSLGVDTDTGWLDNDEIVIASTTRTASQTEKGTLNGNAGASSMTVDGFAGVGGGLAFAHSGTSPTQAEVILLTRNVKVRSATSTIMIYVNIQATATVDIDWSEFIYIGANTATKRGIEVYVTTGSFNCQFSSLHDGEVGGYYSMTATGSPVFSNNVLYNLNQPAGSSNTIQITGTSGAPVMDGNYIIRCFTPTSVTTACVLLADAGMTFTNNVIAGCEPIAGGFMIAVHINENAPIGTFSGNVVHSNVASQGGMNIGTNGTAVFHPLCTGTILSCSVWRNSSFGFYIAAGHNATCGVITLDSCIAFGNTSNISWVGQFVGIFKSLTVNSDTSFSSSIGIGSNASQGGAHNEIHIFDSNIGTGVAHTTTDIQPVGARIYLYNTNLGSSTEVTNVQTPWAFARSHKNDQSSTTFKTWYMNGTINQETTIRHTAGGYAWKLTPSVATRKTILPGPLQYDTFKAAVSASLQVTINVWIQKDSSYNGNAPRLVLVGGIVGGITNDVIDSLTVGADTWEQLSVQATPDEDAVVEWYIDCDGTAGNIYVDDITVEQN